MDASSLSAAQVGSPHTKISPPKHQNISHDTSQFCTYEKQLIYSWTHLDPTGGNAGMAAAYSARQLGIPATIVVPSVTPNPTVERLKDEGATVIIHGKVSSRLSFPLCYFDATLVFSHAQAIGNVFVSVASLANFKSHHKIHYRTAHVKYKNKVKCSWKILHFHKDAFSVFLFCNAII